MEKSCEVLETVRDLGDGLKDWVSLTYSPIDVSSLIDFTKARRAGAVSSFLGTTREFFEDKDVVHLEYEAYTDMALETMLEICDKVRYALALLNQFIRLIRIPIFVYFGRCAQDGRY